jgi:hypothetical protein
MLPGMTTITKPFLPSDRRAASAEPRPVAVNTFVRLVSAYLLREMSPGRTLEEILQKYWPEEQRREVELLTRAASSPATSSTAAWAGVLAQTTSREFLMSLAPASAGSTLLRRGLTFEFDQNDAGFRIPSVVSSVNSSAFVAPGSPIAVEQLSLASVTLSPASLRSITTFTRDVFRWSLPSMEMMVRTTLSESIGLKLDSVMFSNAAAVADVSPAGLLLGLVGITPSTTTPLSEALAEDVSSLAAAVAPVASNGPVIFVASPKQAMALKLWFGANAPFEVLAASALADKTVLCIASNCLASAIGGLNVSVSDSGAVHMEDTTPLALASGSGPTVASPIRSLYQTVSMAAKVSFDVSWALRSSTGLSFMNSVSW